MAEILDLIAKVSWQTNQAELDKLNKAIDKQDDALTELIRKGQRLEQQRAKTDNPAKVKELNKAMEANKKAIDSLTKATDNSAKATLDLVNKQKQLAKAIAESTDPKQASRLLSEFKKLEQQIKTTEKSAGGLVGSFGNIGQSIMGGLGLGVGSLGLESLVGSISSFVKSANQEFIDAEKTSLRLQNTLKNLGQEEYFGELTQEAEGLAKSIGYLDNDDIVSAQQKMLAYGKLSKNEISQLLPVIIDLAAAMETDVPNATETMINIMEGRGGQTLRQMGLTIKDVNSTSERLGVIFEELGPKLAGSAEAVKNSSEGIGRVLDQQIADLEESVGASTIKISNLYKQAYSGFLQLLNDIAKSEEEKRQEGIDATINQLMGYNEKAITEEKNLNKGREAEIKASEQRIAKMRAEIKEKGGFSGMTQDEMNAYLDSLDAETELIKKNQDKISAVNEAYRKFESTKKERAAEDARIKAERDAEDAQKANEEAAKKQAEQDKKNAEERLRKYQALQEKLKGLESELTQEQLTGNELVRAKIEAKYDALLREAKGYDDIIKKLKELKSVELGRVIDAPKTSEADLKAELDGLTADLTTSTRGAALKAVDELKKMNPASEFLQSLELDNLTTSQINQIVSDYKQGQANLKVIDDQRGVAQKEQRDKEIETEKEKKARQQKELEDLYASVQIAASVAQDLISIEQEKNDRLIGLQEERIAAARDSASSSLKIEEDRLNELLEKRQKYERAQRTIDAAVIVANQAVAISQAITAITSSSKLGPAGIAANVIAIIAGLAASIAAVRGATADIPAFREGGYTGDGNPDNVSTTLGPRPYVYHKKEFVMDEELTSKHRDLFEGLHKRDMVVKKLDDGQFYVTRNGLDTTKLVDDHISIKNQMQTDSIVYQLSAINERLSQREVSITNTFDSNGFGNVIATQLGRIEINKKLR